MVSNFMRLIRAFPWWVVFILFILMTISGSILYSAAKGNLYPWAAPQLVRFSVGLGIMAVIAFTNIRFWLDKSYIFYAVCLLLLVIVELFGFIGMGAQRWINIGIFNLQPSELMKVALILAIARYFHYTDHHNFSKIKTYIFPCVLIALPVLLVLRQPDLGTALMLIMVSFCMLFVAGLPWKWISAGFGGLLVFMPVAWSLLKPYQKNRVLTFLDPEKDPLGTGYHIIQSKIALGSGGFWGKGFGLGTQSSLNFLPEKQTDFIFSMFGEEFGFVGNFILFCLYGFIILYGFSVFLQSRTLFNKLVSIGVTSSLFLYMFVNMAMVMGLLPVVGVPLPFISYGGTALLTLLISMGLLIAVDLYRFRNFRKL